LYLTIIFCLQTSEDEFKPPLKKRKVGRPRKNPKPPPIEEVVVKKYQKKEKPISSKPLNNVPTIKVNKIESSSNGQYKIKPKLKAEVKVGTYILIYLITITFTIKQNYFCFPSEIIIEKFSY